MTWTVYGKLRTFVNSKKSGQQAAYRYDAGGKRIRKDFRATATASPITTYYVRDAQGNALATYSKSAANSPTIWDEQIIYGSSRLGMWKPKLNLNTATSGDVSMKWQQDGLKSYELTNHLGNVLATVSDNWTTDNNGVHHPDIQTATDYYAFGGIMPGRNYAATNTTAYRYGFNGKENDNEVKGEGNQQDYGMRIYDPSIAKFLSVDPITKEYPELTPYQFASNTPIWAIDLDGLEGIAATGINGQGLIINTQDAKKINASVATWFSVRHNQGVRNVEMAAKAQQLAIKQGRIDGDGINWFTKTLVYVSPYWQKLSPLTDANDGAVILDGHNLDGSKATKGDYLAAGVGVLLPAISGSSIKKALSGPLHHIFTNKNFIRGEKWSEKFVPLFEKAGYQLDDALNKVRVLGHKGPHPKEYHQAVYDRLMQATEGLEGDAYKRAFNQTLGDLSKEVSTNGTELNKLVTKQK